MPTFSCKGKSLKFEGFNTKELLHLSSISQWTLCPHIMYPAVYKALAVHYLFRFLARTYEHCVRYVIKNSTRFNRMHSVLGVRQNFRCSIKLVWLRSNFDLSFDEKRERVRRRHMLRASSILKVPLGTDPFTGHGFLRLSLARTRSGMLYHKLEYICITQRILHVRHELHCCSIKLPAWIPSDLTDLPLSRKEKERFICLL